MFPEFEQMLAHWRAELDASASAGDCLEVKSYADTLPVILYYDPRRVSPSLIEMPDIVRSRLASRPHLLTAPATDEILGELNLLALWELKQFREQGYHVQFAAFRPFLTPTRGRRTLTRVETGLREALAVWAWAFMPSVDYLLALLPAPDRNDVPLSLAWLSEYGPSVVRLAEDSLAKRPDPSASPGSHDPIDDLHGLLPRLFDEGRRVRIKFRDGKGRSVEFFGVALQNEILRRVASSIKPGSPRSHAISWAKIFVAIIDVLAKANLATSALTKAEIAVAQAVNDAADKMQGRGALKTFNDPDTGKRDRSTAGKIVRGLRLDPYVQASSSEFPLSFEAKELAIIAIFSGVDPYLVCGQHLLLAEDLIAVRESGDWILGRSEAIPRRADVIHRWQSAELEVSLDAHALAEQLTGIRDAYAAAEALLLPDRVHQSAVAASRRS